jgi:beta-glucosidase
VLELGGNIGGLAVGGEEPNLFFLRRKSMKNNKQPKVVLWAVLSVLFVVLFVASMVANYFAQMYRTTINVALGTSDTKVVGYDESAIDYPSDFESDDARWEYEKELCATLEAEGAALLKNDNNALPLASGAKVSLFARGSVDLM